MLRTLLDTPGGLWQLFRLGVITRFRFRGEYWTWRLHTAFGRSTPARGEMVRSILDYGRWMHRTRGFGRR